MGTTPPPTVLKLQRCMPDALLTFIVHFRFSVALENVMQFYYEHKFSLLKLVFETFEIILSKTLSKN